jgi:archaellum component FlaC
MNEKRHSYDLELLTETENDQNVLDYSNELNKMRDKDLLNAIGKIADKFKARIEKIENRIECLEGDSIILALSITYLGVFPIKS